MPLIYHAKLDTCGDWHQSAIQWAYPQMRESAESLFGDYGIEGDHYIPEHPGKTFYVANTIRACLDLLCECNFAVVQGMNKDYICNEKYDNEIFIHVYALRTHRNWEAIDGFMMKEYHAKWMNFRNKREGA